ncbi:MAG: flagellar hook-basal body complex protein FliE [Alphaproteobacteria bacterium]|nr:flagellar hook-basal body complex protein FliE [Alphaproteobacteria bacterium]MBU0797039.1 flagellar hook-basal body complex protein FliE [Alphaproteobacteria bacterium]MBU0886555.1 flagellar hook-basal body complex protein FliE [Alphaproteobacteria bacterium]MBU1814143.1 flagellar hook-basal body complex protein FliE [Alphaproteobacteria bacterium]MBU2089967.1 flagellar hook-basal body complex protein FliE [Alphaproteobacteria bacterium]
MVAKIGDAIAAYTKVPQGAGMEARDAGRDFASFIRDAAGDAHEIMKTGESMSLKAVTGQADLNDVVTAVNNAEVTLQTVVGLRDRMVQAYQEILRMPI